MLDKTLKVLYSILIIMALCIVYNLVTEYIVPEIMEGEISLKPKSWRY